MFRTRHLPAVILGTATAYLGAQLWHTVRDRNRWPFCAYNMFNYRVPETWEQLRIVLYDDRGRTTGPQDPWGLLPVEFFRVVSILESVLIGNQDEKLKEEFCERTLHRLNTARWPDFDEVRASAALPDGRPFAALEVYLVEVDAVRCDPRDRASVLSAGLLHRHDPGRVTGPDGPRWRPAAGSRAVSGGVRGDV
ncbi:hypothetical protein ABZ419_05530 [Streptomyces cinnamoneus]|uniref:hypothetical protein n=1 Tax=Streptomyces cinnamoneus TaxID=53446 RepID=UPI0033E4358F